MENHGRTDVLAQNNPAQARECLLQRYKESIEFYWRASRKNKTWFYFTEQDLTPGAIRVDNFAGYTPFRGTKGTCREGGNRVPMGTHVARNGAYC